MRSLNKHQQSDGASLTFASLTNQLSIFLKGIVLFWTILMAAGCVWMFYQGSVYAVEFSIIAVPSVIALWFWRTQPRSGMPFFPFMVIQQSVVFLMPLWISNKILMTFQDDIHRQAALSVGLFLCTLPLGWKIGSAACHPLPSKWDLAVGEGKENSEIIGMRISLFLLQGALCIQLIPYFINIGGLAPTLNAASNAASSLGALLGGYAIGLSGRSNPRFWGILVLLFFIAIRDVVLSSAMIFIVASIFGMALGSKKIPWKPLVIILTVISFLSAGKYTMRERYWIDSNSTNLPLTALPGFYQEWARVSLETLATGTDQATLTARQVKAEQELSFGERINNFENMDFVIRALLQNHLSPLYGQTYALIPPLFIPRFLWADKPRTHAGQILLNVHFGRQTIEQTDRTNIAWGVVAEAVGNFGPWIGPIFIGLVAGFLYGFLEVWSSFKKFLSVEGFAIISLFLLLLIAFEMVSSVLITAIFQMLIVVVMGGMMLRNVFGSR